MGAMAGSMLVSGGDPREELDPRAAFSVAPGTIYLDAATYGLLPTPAVHAMQEALASMGSGTGRWIEDWDAPAESCRADLAAICGLDASTVALLPAVSVGVGLVAATLGAGHRVVVPADEFTSVLFPLLVARERGAEVREVAWEELPGAIVAGTTLVALSLVQMQTGRRADLGEILDAAERVGARVLLDVTQAVPFLDPDEDLSRVDHVVAHGYKHLLCPRGVAFMAVRGDRVADLPPLVSNWRAADRPYERFFEGPLTLGPGARRFDVSLAWLAWAGAVESLRLLREWQAWGLLEVVRKHADALAGGTLAGRAVAGGAVGHGGGPLPGAPSPARAPSTLVCLPVADPAAAGADLAAASIRASIRGGLVRLSVHVWNDEAEIARVLEVLAPHLASPDARV
jgi:selenocysteine lyase/cysteine desulfurase